MSKWKTLLKVSKIGIRGKNKKPFLFLLLLRNKLLSFAHFCEKSSFTKYFTLNYNFVLLKFETKIIMACN